MPTPSRTPPRRSPSWPALARAGLVALALTAPGSARPGEAGCPDGMRALAGGRFTLADGSEVAEVGALCLDLGEVTAAAYAACVARGACSDANLRCGKTATYGNRSKADHPVNCVSWEEADRFCRAQGKRLPTEAEWEWAARGRLRALVYPWGAAAPAGRACWDGPGNTLGKGGRNETCAVGAFPGGDSPDGLHDLGGNVREWTSSKVGRDRVVRGGSWGDSLPDFLAAGFRGMNKSDERFEITGFRCAASPGLLAEPRPVVRDVPLPPPPVLRAPPAAPPAASSVARLGPPRSTDDLEEEGVIVAPLDPPPAPPPRAAPPPVAPPPPPPPAAKVARPEPRKAAPPARTGPRLDVEIGEIRIEPLSGRP